MQPHGPYILFPLSEPLDTRRYGSVTFWLSVIFCDCLIEPELGYVTLYTGSLSMVRAHSGVTSGDQRHMPVTCPNSVTVSNKDTSTERHGSFHGGVYQ
jgi:hypothetical protein